MPKSKQLNRKAGTTSAISSSSESLRHVLYTSVSYTKEPQSLPCFLARPMGSQICLAHEGPWSECSGRRITSRRPLFSPGMAAKSALTSSASIPIARRSCRTSFWPMSPPFQAAHSAPPKSKQLNRKAAISSSSESLRHVLYTSVSYTRDPQSLSCIMTRPMG